MDRPHPSDLESGFYSPLQALIRIQKRFGTLQWHITSVVFSTYIGGISTYIGEIFGPGEKIHLYSENGCGILE